MGRGMIRFTLTTLSTFALLALACSSPNDADDKDKDSKDAETVCADYIDGALALSERCDFSFISEARDGMISECKYMLSLPGIATGLSDAIAACGKDLKDQSCKFRFDSGPCAKLEELRGDFDAGAACESDGQCQSGSCNQTADNKCGTCAKLVGKGEKCNNADLLCDADLDCPPVEGERTCVAFGEVGDACDPFGEEGPECNRRKGLACIDNKCAAAPKLGEACEQFGGGCEEGYCGDDKTCKALPKEGEPCYMESFCDIGLSCDEATTTCKKATRIAREIGQKCTWSDSCKDSYCKVQIDEEEDDGVCTAFIAKGGNCDESKDIRCESGLRCNTSGKCEELTPLCTY